MRTSENYLVQKLKAGDKKAFEIVFKSYFTCLANYAFSLVSDMEVAKDLTGDIFHYVWENRKILCITHSLKSYLYKTTHNRCLDYLKREQVKLKHIKESIFEKQQEEQNNILFASYYQPSYFTEEIDKTLKNAIDSLPEQAKKIFTMKRFEGMSYKEISEKLGISENTIRKQMSRSLQKIKTAILVEDEQLTSLK